MVRRIIDFINFVVCSIMIIIGANGYFFVKEYRIPVVLIVIMIMLANILPFFSAQKHYDRFRICNYGVICLNIFIVSTLASIGIGVYLLVNSYYYGNTFLIATLICAIVEGVVLCNGIACTYFASVQLGVRMRVLSLLFAFMPIVNIFFLLRIIKIVSDEVKLETEKYELNEYRKDLQLCKTKYPILLVHGVFFRDFQYFNYWGRIPEELEKNGAVIYYGNHQSALSVVDSANELASRIKSIVEENNCEKVNIIAHSKGGIDCRYAIANCGIADYVASLTTINTPHRGCKFADYILEKMPDKMENDIAVAYNKILNILGDEKPDLMSAVYDLTSDKGTELDGLMPLPDNIYCHSVGSKLKKAIKGKFPLNFSYYFVKQFDGDNDGLVGEDSFKWSDNYTFVDIKGKRGISHADIIDLNRENIKNFDVREWYVNLVIDLKERGL